MSDNGRSKQRVIDEAQFNFNRGVEAAYKAVEAVRDRYPAPNGVIFASHALAAIKEVKQ